MKNLKTILGVVLVTVLTMTSCSKDELAEPMVQDTTVNNQVVGDLPTDSGYGKLDSMQILSMIYSDYTYRMWGIETGYFIQTVFEYHQNDKTTEEILTLLEFSLTVMSYAYSNGDDMGMFFKYTDDRFNDWNEGKARITLWEISYPQMIKEVKYFNYFEKYHTTYIHGLDR